MADIFKYVSLANLTKYDEKIKEHIANADDALKSNLEGQVEVVATALDGEIARAKAAEQANAAAAQVAQTTADNIAGKVGTVPEGQTVMSIIDNIQENAYDDTEVRNLISGLDTNKADKTQVATDIADAVKVETDARVEAVVGVQGNIDALGQTVASNKTAIENTVSDLDAKVDANESDIEEKMTALTSRVAANETAVGTTLPNSIAEVDAKVDILVGNDANKSVRAIANEELAKQLIVEDAQESLDTLAEIAAWIQAHPDDAAAMNAAIEALQNKVDTGDKTVSAYVTAAINALSIGDYAKATDLIALADRVSALETDAKTHALKSEVQAISDAMNEYKDAHASDYTNSQIDAAIKVNTDAIANLNDTYATDIELAQAIENEVTRSNNTYAAKTLETTVANHVADTVTHITDDERTLWNTIGDFEECTTDEINALFIT